MTALLVIVLMVRQFEALVPAELRPRKARGRARPELGQAARAQVLVWAVDQQQIHVELQAARERSTPGPA